MLVLRRAPRHTNVHTCANCCAAHEEEGQKDCGSAFGHRKIDSNLACTAKLTSSPSASCAVIARGEKIAGRSAQSLKVDILVRITVNYQKCIFKEPQK